jgi:hypothetical protein
MSLNELCVLVSPVYNEFKTEKKRKKQQHKGKTNKMKTLWGVTGKA